MFFLMSFVWVWVYNPSVAQNSMGNHVRQPYWPDIILCHIQLEHDGGDLLTPKVYAKQPLKMHTHFITMLTA